jgi:HSP20 family protein
MTALTQWQPFREITSLQERMNQMFHDAFSGLDSWEPTSLSSSSFVPRTDIYEEDDKVVLDIETPGMREEDLNITLEGNTLTVDGERKMENERKKDRYQRVERWYGSFSRTFTLPGTIDPNSIEAKYEHGILHVTMTKKADARPRQIKVTGQAKQITAKAA